MKHALTDQIVRIEGYELVSTLPERIGNSRRTFDGFSTLLITVRTRGGVTGWGETWAFPAAAGALIRTLFFPVVRGLAVSAPRAIWAAMEGQLGQDRRGQSHMAMSAIDMAVWDAFGRLEQKPVSALLGGALRDRVRAYASGPFLKDGADPYRDFEADIKGYLAAGFTAIKMRMGTTAARDGALAMRVRRMVGPDFPLMVDLNEGYSVRGAVEMADALTEAGLVWLEEPIAHDNLAGYGQLASRLPMALAGGEGLCGLGAFRDFIAAGALGVVQPDVALCGGFSEFVRIAALADAFDIPVVPHVWGSGVALLAALQAIAILPERRGGTLNYPLFEYEYGRNRLSADLVHPAIDADGMVAIPDGPGLGAEVDIDRLAPFIINRWVLE